ncbi:DUF799 domain-containing protein [Janthinobacterium sp.]|uniref:DUF799 domain-containing protein n=1 Tax=Janthinobacterium sp. TaxID=1871054 RepID=UPI00293D6E2C|nr:DUF799 domain-containing protein [Janthinobacterium sp.]
MLKKTVKLAACLIPALLAVGCATKPAAPYDYTAFKLSKPRSIVVLPPLNNSPDVKATYSMLSQVSYPLAEAGYYVLPVALVDETFKQNGLSNSAEIHAVAPAKIQEIFGADAALYVTVSNYGTTYAVIDSVSAVTADAKLVDLKSGALLWAGSATASSNEGGNNGGGGLIGALVAAAVKQIINTATDAAHPIAGVTSNRLLAGGRNNGMLYGPRSANYKEN